MDFPHRERRRYYSRYLTTSFFLLGIVGFVLLRPPTSSVKPRSTSTPREENRQPANTHATAAPTPFTTQETPVPAELNALMGSKDARALLQNRSNSLKESEVVEGSGVRTTKFQHYYKGLEVVGSMAMVHRGPAGEQVQSNLTNVELDTVPSIKPDQAGQIAIERAGNEGKTKGPPTLKILPSEDRQSADLVYQVKVDNGPVKPVHEIWINAKTGDVVADMTRREKW